MGFRLYRQLSRSWQVTSFLVRNCMLSMLVVLCLQGFKYCVVLAIPQHIYLD
jgi:hypothetical protein